MFYVYRHIRLDKNEPFYIGVGKKYAYSRDEYKRAKVKAKRNIIWNRIVNKTQYEIEIIYESDNEELIKQKETEFIKLHGRIDLNTGILANTIWDEARRNTTRLRFKNNTTWVGRKRKQESIDKGANKLKGRKHTTEARSKRFNTKPQAKKVYCETNNQTYNSICECIRKLFHCDLNSYDNVFRNYKHQVSAVCNGKKELYKKYKFKFI
jgi:hypothetical protein